MVINVEFRMSSLKQTRHWPRIRRAMSEDVRRTTLFGQLCQQRRQRLAINMYGASRYDTVWYETGRDTSGIS